MAARNLIGIAGVKFDRADTTQKHPLGMELAADDGRVYAYYRAGATVAVNSALKVDVAEGPNDLDPTANADVDVIAGVAMTALADNEFGWCVRRGPATVKAAATVVAGASAVSIATAGTLDDTAAATANALAAGSRCVFTSTTTSGLASVYLF